MIDRQTALKRLTDKLLSQQRDGGCEINHTSFSWNTSHSRRPFPASIRK